jgi:tRNA threonylcarbamoyladenosine biosynthesis protein TsaB
LLLSIDTCGPSGSVALARYSGEEIEVLAQTALPGKTYSAALVPTIRDLLAAHSTSIAALTAIVVTSGPGSFTGIRIALATAKGLAELHSTPLIAVSRLAVLAYKAKTNAAALDASRNEFYCGQYDGEPYEQLLTLDPFQQLSSTLNHPLAVCEPSVHEVAPEATLVDPPTAADALNLALPRLLARDFDNPLALDGNYLRRSDAEIFAKSPRPIAVQPAALKSE